MLSEISKPTFIKIYGQIASSMASPKVRPRERRKLMASNKEASLLNTEQKIKV